MSIALTSSSSGAAPYLFFKVQRLNGPNPNYIAKRLHKASCRVQVAPYLFLHITRVICGAGTDQTSTRTSKPSVMGSFLLSLVTSPPPQPLMTPTPLRSPPTPRPRTSSGRPTRAPASWSMPSCPIPPLSFFAQARLLLLLPQLVVDFSTSWCRPCRFIEAKTIHIHLN
jgi:hypothetical protein